MKFADNVNKIFSNIHDDYDLMNHLMSFGVDKTWRKNAAKESMLERKTYALLDIGAGTGDMSIAIKEMGNRTGKKISITAVDFNNDMLDIARQKIKKKGFDIKILEGDALDMKFRNGSFDIVVSAFAPRDFSNLKKASSEFHRVLKKGGKLVILEMSEPQNKFGKLFFNLYSKLILFEGFFVNREAYVFLVHQIYTFDRKKLAKTLKESGFSRIKIKTQFSGVAFIVTAEK